MFQEGRKVIQTEDASVMIGRGKSSLEHAMDHFGIPPGAKILRIRSRTRAMELGDKFDASVIRRRKIVLAAGPDFETKRGKDFFVIIPEEGDRGKL